MLEARILFEAEFNSVDGAFLLPGGTIVMVLGEARQIPPRPDSLIIGISTEGEASGGWTVLTSENCEAVNGSKNGSAGGVGSKRKLGRSQAEHVA
jgi:hypothetical protein